MMTLFNSPLQAQRVRMLPLVTALATCGRRPGVVKIRCDRVPDMCMVRL